MGEEVVPKPGQVFNILQQQEQPGEGQAKLQQFKGRQRKVVTELKNNVFQPHQGSHDIGEDQELAGDLGQNPADQYDQDQHNVDQPHRNPVVQDVKLRVVGEKPN